MQIESPDRTVEESQAEKESSLNEAAKTSRMIASKEISLRLLSRLIRGFSNKSKKSLRILELLYKARCRDLQIGSKLSSCKSMSWKA